MAKLSEWLDIMLGEIARKQDEAVRAASEQARRASSSAAAPAEAAASKPAAPRSRRVRA